jgi:hypothetical protein
MIQKPIGWYFPQNSNQGDVLNDQFIDSKFAIDPWTSFTREVIQNSLDASDQTGNPVKVVFSIQSFERKEIPGIETLKSVIEACERGTNHEQTKLAYKKAISKLSANQIICLKVSDFNTTGIVEGREENWGKLLNDTGTGLKRSSTSAGSHGLGKKTSFLVSSVNTVYYSTIYQNKLTNELVRLFQGRTALINWMDEKLDRKSLDGWYGENDEKRDSREVSRPLKNSQLNNINQFFSREEMIGADIIIPAVDIEDRKEIQNKIILSVIENFFVAICKNKIELDIFGTLINFTNFEDFVKSFYIQDNIDFKLLNPNLVQGNLLNYVDAFFNSQVDKISVELEGKLYGHLEIFIVNRNNLNRKYYSLYRSHGMKIQDKRLQTETPFSAVVIIEGQDLNESLRRIENPAHDNFEIEGKFVNQNEEMIVSNKLVKIVWKLIDNYIQEKTRIKVDKEYELEDISSYLSIQGNMSFLTTVTPKIDLSRRIIRRGGKDSISLPGTVPKPKPPKPKPIPTIQPGFGKVKFIDEFLEEPMVIFDGYKYILSFKVDANINKVNILLTAENLSGSTNTFVPLIKNVFHNGIKVHHKNNDLKGIVLNQGNSGNITFELKTKRIYKLVPEINRVLETTKDADNYGK